MSITRHDPCAPTRTRAVPAGTGIDAHHHDEHQVLYASQGVISVATDDGVWITAAGRALWVPAGVTHRHRAFGDARIHTVRIPISTAPAGLPRSTAAVIAVSALLRELVIAYAAGSFDGRQRDRLRAVLVDQLNTADQQPLELPLPDDPRLVEMQRLLYADPAERRSAPQLAHQVGASSRTLFRLCRNELGMSFPQWRTQIRIHHALQLLAEGASVTTVAQQCGWATSSAFIEAFRTTVGHTPAAEKRALATNY